MLTKPNILRLVFFVLAFAAALYCPVRKVLAFERPAVPPTELRFGVRGYDPRDLARGHYLQLNTYVEIKLTDAECEAQKKLLNGCNKAFAVLDDCMSRGVARMRNFQRALLDAQFHLAAYSIDKIVDVDHAADIATAEQFLTHHSL